jgi:tetratricopeptide (TPR) repeat protein
VRIAAAVLGVLLSAPTLAPASGAQQQATPQQEARLLVQRSINLLSADRLDEAIGTLERAVTLDPENPEVRYYLGRALHATERHEEALRHLEIGLPNAPDPGAFQLVIGLTLIELDRLVEAREALDAAAVAQPELTEIPFHLARICYWAGDIEAALEGFARVAAAAPGWTAPLLEAADIAASQGDHVTEAAQLSALLAIEPRRSNLWIRYADALMSQADSKGALRAYETAIRNDPASPSPHLAIAYFFFNEQRFEEAELALYEVLQRAPGHPLALLPLADVLRIDGRQEEALEALEAAQWSIEMTAPARPGPDSALLSSLEINALEVRCRVLTSLNRVEEAEAAARALLAADPSNTDGLFTLGTALVRSGDPEGREYLQTFQKLSTAREKRDTASRYFYLSGDPERAVTEYEKALAIDPEDALALTGLGTVQLALGDAAQALETLASAREAGDDSPDWYLGWVLALNASGRTDEANQAWLEARERGMTLGPKAWAALGRHQGACSPFPGERVPRPVSLGENADPWATSGAHKEAGARHE